MLGIDIFQLDLFDAMGIVSFSGVVDNEEIVGCGEDPGDDENECDGDNGRGVSDLGTGIFGNCNLSVVLVSLI